MIAVVARLARHGMLSVIMARCGFIIAMPLYLSAGRKSDWHPWSVFWLVLLTPVAVSLSSWLLLQAADLLRQGVGEIIHSTVVLAASTIPVILGRSIKKSVMVAFKLDPFERVADWIHKG